jgi:hypothetical protein
MSPVLVNPYISFTAPGGGGVVDLTDPWEEFDRTSTIVSGELTLSGYDLTGVAVVKAILSGVTITTDDSTVAFRLHVGGSEVATGYQVVISAVNSAGTAADVNSTSTTEVPLTEDADATRKLGNVSTEGLGAEITIYSPGSTSLYKRCMVTGTYGQAGGEVARVRGACELTNTGAVTGITVFGSSDLTAGTLVLLGLE